MPAASSPARNRIVTPHAAKLSSERLIERGPSLTNSATAAPPARTTDGAAANVRSVRSG